MAQVLSQSAFPIDQRAVRADSPEALPSEDVRAQINYISTDLADPYHIISPKDGEQQSNKVSEPHGVDIEDIRLKKDQYTTDSAGFQFIDDSKHDPEYELFSDEKRIEEEYYPQIESILKEHLGASRVFIFDHTLRRRQENAVDSVSNRQPVVGAHVDQTEVAAVARVHRHLGDEAPELLKGRVRLVNTWRPLFDNLTDTPLSVADYRSVDPANDLVVSKLIYPTFTGYTYSVRYNPNHKWKYHSHQNKNDVLLIKCYDSYDNVARLTPHTAFVNPRTPDGARLRESIEVRALVFG